MLARSPEAQLEIGEQLIANELQGEDPPKPPSPFIEHEREPPRRQSNLKYQRLETKDSIEVTVTAMPGRVIEEVRKVIMKDGRDDVLHIVTRRSRGRPTKQQHDSNGADHG